MRIICVIDTFRIGGGAQTQLAGLVVMLRQSGHDVTAVSYHQVQDEQSYGQYMTEQGMEHICPTVSGFLGKFTSVDKIIKQKRPDAVIAYIDGPTIICCLSKLTSSKRYKLIVSERH